MDEMNQEPLREEFESEMDVPEAEMQEAQEPDWKELAKQPKPEEPEEKKFSLGKLALQIMSYAIVAALASAVTLTFFASRGSGYSKLEELKELIGQWFIGEVDDKQLEDMAASAMVLATGDKWSYYIPAADLQSVIEQKENSYVGVGITITILEEDQGFLVNRIEPDSPALAAGIQVGDVVVAVDGVRVSDVGSDKARDMVSGQEGTGVTITVLRDGRELNMEMTRRKIIQAVATGRMVTDSIGYICINNFNSRSAQETIRLFDQLEAQGATAMIFDVRFNPGGYKDEMVKVLDYLLPEGVLFRSEDSTGYTWEDTSDANCKKMPMVVLINGESYSAAEFFAAALKEYDYAVTVGQATTGKGHFQSLFYLSDGSAVNLSIGKYYTPNGVSLAEVGGLVPDIPVEVDEQTMDRIYTQTLPDEEDAQLQAAIAQLTIPQLN